MEAEIKNLNARNDSINSLLNAKNNSLIQLSKLVKDKINEPVHFSSTDSTLVELHASIVDIMSERDLLMKEKLSLEQEILINLPQKNADSQKALINSYEDAIVSQQMAIASATNNMRIDFEEQLRALKKDLIDERKEKFIAKSELERIISRNKEEVKLLESKLLQKEIELQDARTECESAASQVFYLNCLFCLYF